MSVKIDLIIAVLAIVAPIVLAIIGASWKLAQGLGSLGQQVKGLDSTISQGLGAAEQRTSEARAEAEEKIVRVHERVDGLEGRMTRLTERVAGVEVRCEERGKPHGGSGSAGTCGE